MKKGQKVSTEDAELMIMEILNDLDTETLAQIFAIVVDHDIEVIDDEFLKVGEKRKLV